MAPSPSYTGYPKFHKATRDVAEHQKAESWPTPRGTVRYSAIQLPPCMRHEILKKRDNLISQTLAKLVAKL
ncbi:hypothetical protein V496_07506 [Pseudogymnoascus sp. VKM F-4515 (FW-2607)]|nr:hypothetical protein V496_07506 [Pseudogymnoascus sp. VKM F-4515 (FW-2607)]